MIGNCQLTLIPDPCFEYNLIVMGLDTGEVNGFVPTANIDTVTYLHLGGSPYGEANNVIGIEDFVALEEVWIIDHNITSLDLSHSPNLRKVRCLYNQIEWLDFSQNPKLEELDCYVNRIKVLDLSANPMLNSLRCFSNRLHCLNIKNGNNHNMSNDDFRANWCDSLMCIEVDDPVWSLENWDDVDSWVSFSTNCDNDCSADDMIEETDTDYLIFPNPNSGEFKLDFRTEEEGSLEILDAIGQRVQLLVIEPFIYNSYKEDLSNGIYFIRITVGELVLSERMVVN